MNANSGSFEEIALPYIDSVYRTAVAICGKPEDVGDLVQDVFLKALDNFGSFELGTNCKAWLLKILRNTWIDQLRHRKVVGQTLPLEEEMIAQTAHDDGTVWSNAKDLLENFADKQIIKALSGLPEEQRLTLFLIDVEQLSQMDVADITGVPVGTVKSRASRGRAILKEQLASYAKEMGLMGG